MSAPHRQSDDINVQVLRILPFWPTVYGVIAMVAIGATAVATIYVKVDSATETINELKTIAISTSGKLNDVKSEQAVQRVQISEISRRIEGAEGNINAIRQDVWQLQQQATFKR